MRALKAKRKRKSKKIEKVQVDPAWFAKLLAKRRKTGEDDADEQIVERTSDTKDQESAIKNCIQPLDDESAQNLKKSLLLDYLHQIKGFMSKLKLKMYILLIKLLNSSKAWSDGSNGEGSPDLSISASEDDIVQFILSHDRESFFNVTKSWVHYEYNESLLSNGKKFDVLLPYILNKITSARLFLNSGKWISFILSLPAYPPIIFKHIYQVCIESVQKDVPAIKLLQKFLMSSVFKLAIKKEGAKLLLRCTLSQTKGQVKKQAISALLAAHANGIFQMKKMDALRNYFYELLDLSFQSAYKETSKPVKLEMHKQLVYLIFSIILDNTKLPKVDIEEQERIDESKFCYFGLIFKHFNSMEDETKSLLLKQYFYRLIGGEKFKESNNKPLYGPLTKAEFKSCLKHPVKYEENPLLDLIKQSLRQCGSDEHDCLLEFVKILKSKAKLTVDIYNVILRVCILNDNYNDVIKETFSTVFKMQNYQRVLKNAAKETDAKPEICVLLKILLDHNNTAEDQSKLQSSSKRGTHSVIIKALLELPAERKDIFNECIESFNEGILADVLNEILDAASEETISVVMEKYTMFMRSMLIVAGYHFSSRTDNDIQSLLQIIYKLVKKGGWMNKIQWKGIKLFLKQCKDFVNLENLAELPQEQAEELYEVLEITRAQS